MIINLMPVEYKQKIRRYYIGRLISVCLFTGGFLALVAMVSYSPSYFLLSIKSSAASQTLNNFKKEEQFSISEETQKSIKDINNKLKILSQIENVKPVSDIVPNALILAKPEGVKITSMLYFSEGATARGEVRGVASSREILLLFVKNIEANKSFTNVVLPISSLLKGRDIEYAITFSVVK